MVRLKPSRLVADNRIGGSVRFVKAVVREFLKKVKNLRRLFLIDAVFHRAFFELRTLFRHFLGDLLTHRATQKVSATKAVARHDLRDLHHLFLVNNNTLGFSQQVINRLVD